MSTKVTLARHPSDQPAEPSWRIYEKESETGVIYLELRGVSAELQTHVDGGADLVVRLPVKTARELGLCIDVSAEQWRSVRGNDMTSPLDQIRGTVLRYDDPTEPV